MIESRIHIIFLFLIIAYASQSYPYLYTPQMSLSIFYHRLLLKCAWGTQYTPYFALKKPPDWNRTVNKRELHPCALSPRVTLTHRHTKMLPCAGMRKCLLTYTNLQAPFSSVLSSSSSPVWWFWLGQNRRKSLAFIQVLFFLTYFILPLLVFPS